MFASMKWGKCLDDGRDIQTWLTIVPAEENTKVKKKRKWNEPNYYQMTQGCCIQAILGTLKEKPHSNDHRYIHESIYIRVQIS